MYLFSEGPKEYDFLLKILSLGRDSYWRATTIKEAQVKRGDLVLDIACGPGTLTYEIARRNAFVLGVDITREMIRTANSRSKNTSADVDFVLARAEQLPIRSDCFDSAVISLAMRNVSSISKTLSEMARCVKLGRRVLTMDFTRPTGNFFLPFYYFYIFRVLPSLGIIVSRHWNGILSYLAGSIMRSKNPETIAKVMEELGLSRVSLLRMTHGVTALTYGTKGDLQE